MKQIIITLTVIAFFTNNFYAQVGIGNTAPKATLDIQATNQSNPSNEDGLLIPRINAFPTSDPGADQDGMLVYLTTDNTFYYWENSVSEWIPLYSKSTTVIQGADQHYVGELYGGGIIFYVYQNGQHGLIASLDDLGDPSWGGEWGPDYTGTNDKSWWDGASNTAAAVAEGAGPNTAIGLCDAYSSTVDGITYDDWHLPSIGELKALEEAAYVLFKVLDEDGDSNTNAPDYSSDYWASTADGNKDAYSFSFDNTHTNVEDRGSWYKIRAVRSF